MELSTEDRNKYQEIWKNIYDTIVCLTVVILTWSSIYIITGYVCKGLIYLAKISTLFNEDYGIFSLIQPEFWTLSHFIAIFVVFITILGCIGFPLLIGLIIYGLGQFIKTICVNLKKICRECIKCCCYSCGCTKEQVRVQFDVEMAN